MLAHMYVTSLMDSYSHTTELRSGQELSLKIVSISPLIAIAQPTAANIHVKTKETMTQSSSLYS